MQPFSICSRSTVSLVFCILLHSIIVRETSASDATCQADAMADLDFFKLFTQQVHRNTTKLPPEAPRMEGMDPENPAFEFSGQGLHYNDSEAAKRLRNISCDTKQLTIYASMFFKATGDVGGPLVALTQYDASSDKTPIMGLFVELASNQFVLMYHHRNLARVEKFNHEIPRGKWFRVSVTVSGSVMVVHIDCKEVLRRVIPVPDYCIGSNNIVASVGATEYQTEFNMGFTGSLQNVGIWFGMDGLKKQCDQVTVPEICPTCSKYLVTLNRVYELRMQVTQLKARLAAPTLIKDDPPTLPSTIPTSSSGHSCLIDDLSHDDHTFVFNRAGDICFCDNGNARCKNPDSIPTIPPLATAMSTTSQPNRARAESTKPQTCTVSPNQVTIGKDDKYYVKNGDMCVEYDCILFFGEITARDPPTEYDCQSRYSQCNQNFTEFERNISICCDTCTACDFSSCPENSSCRDQGGITFTCACNTGFEPSMNGSCLDRNECKLGHQQAGHNCPAHSTCVNTIGSFDCNCDAGFRKGANGACEDIDECKTNTHNCPLHSICINEVPGYRCNCTSGYEMKDKLCVPICDDGCANGGRCIMPNKCDCRLGFTGASCDMDINECSNPDLNECRHSKGNCVNTFGGHFCRCANGYQHRGDTCADVDECRMGIAKCIPGARCDNTYGTYRCVCNGTNCTGYCSKDNQIMTNKQSKLFGRDKCDNCTCNDGELSCKPVNCDCSNPNVSPACCPQCRQRTDNSVCVIGKQVVTKGTEIPDPRDPCIKRRCNSSAMIQIINKKNSCPVPNCDPSEQYLPSGACCKVCELPRCSAQNNGTTIRLSNGCRTCTCKYFNSMSKEWDCASRITCPSMKSCPSSQIVYLKGQCCPICQRTLLSPPSCSSS